MAQIDKIPFQDRNPIFKRIEEVCSISSLTKSEYRSYMRSLQDYNDRNAEIEYIENKVRAESLRNLLAYGMQKAQAIEALRLSPEEADDLLRRFPTGD